MFGNNYTDPGKLKSPSVLLLHLSGPFSCGFALISVVPLEAGRESRADIPALLLHSPAGTLGSPRGKQALLLQHHHRTAVSAP